MTLVWILGAFLAFIAIIWSVHRVDDYASVRHGYAPFALTNVLFMLIPNGLLLLATRVAGGEMQVLVLLAGAAAVVLFLLVRSRTNGWIALIATTLMLLCAPVLFFSVLFRSLAGASGGEEG